MSLASCFGKKWALWTYSFGQILLFSAFFVAVSPLYYTTVGTVVYCSLLVVQMLLNGGRHYSYKLRKLEMVTVKLEEYEGEGDEETGSGYFDGEEEKKEEEREYRLPKKTRTSKRNIATVIRTVDAFSIDTDRGRGRAQRSAMAQHSAGSRKARVHDEAGDRDTEESVGVLAAQRREYQRRSQRPTVF